MKIFRLPNRRNVATAPPPTRVCMHVHSVARLDPRVLREATALVQAGFTVVVVDIEGEAGRPAIEEIQGVFLHHVRMPGWYISTSFPWSLFKAALMFLRTILCLLRTSADVYHAHDVAALPACYIAARLKRTRLIFDAHELPLLEMPLAKMSRSRRFIHPLLSWLFVRMLPACAGIIVTSSPMAEEIARRYHCADITVVRNVPPYQEIAASDRLRSYLGLSSQTRIALYQGNIQPDRELDKLVCAAHFLRDQIVIVLMGKGDPKTLTELAELIASEQVGERVKCIPPVPYAELLDWTASADIGLSILSPDFAPYHMQVCLPNKLFEYLMAGLPVLAAPLAAVAEIINTHEIGHVLASLVPAEIGAAINTMLANPNELAHMREKALRVARQEFFWEKERLQLISLYREILALPDTLYQIPENSLDLKLQV